MSERKTTKKALHALGRTLVLLFNRATMYQVDHPHVKQTIDELHLVIKGLLTSISPLVFIMNRGQLFIDEEPLDPRISVSRILGYFKKTKIQSISFEKGLGKNEIRAFLAMYTSPDKYPNADVMKKGLTAKGIRHLKINHVVFIKATKDDEVVSRDAFKKLSPEITEGAHQESKKLFMDTVLESVLADEFGKIITIENLMKNPAGLSKNMIEADLASFRESAAENRRPGPVLMHQLEVLNQEVEKNLSDNKHANLSEMATAVFDMKNELTAGIKAQEAKEVTYSDETMILDKVNEVTDNVLLRLVKDESKAGGMSSSRLAEILRKLVPEADERRRVVPKIKAALEEKTLTIENLMKNPAGLSKNMIEADLAGFRESAAENRRPGPVLMHQLEVLNQEVEKNLSDNKHANLSEMAGALFDMKKQLIAAIETQKTLGIAYSNEEMILDKVNEIADNVLLQLVKDEYKAGEISTSRLAQILRRLVPEADELKRLLPKIKAALLKEGMPLSEYLRLVQELGRELQSEELAKILQESAEEIGMDSESLIQEVKRNPVQAAELISLAAEMRKGTGDEKVLRDLLVDYIEQMGSEAVRDIATDNGAEGEQHLRQVITDIESALVARLRKMDIKDDVLGRLEQRFNDRMDEVLEKVKMDIIHSQSSSPEKDGQTGLSVLQILEQNVGESEELGEILKIVRSKAQSKSIDEDNFSEIYAEITKQQQKTKEQEEQKKMPDEVLKGQTLMVFIDKEISRAKRYGVPFAALAFSLVKAKPRKQAPSSPVTHRALIDEILKKLLKIVRDADIVGEFGKNKIVVLLNNTPAGGAEKALRRCLKLLYLEPIEVDSTPFAIKMAGVATKFNVVNVPDAKAFVKALSNELMQMEIRIKNIQTLF